MTKRTIWYFLLVLIFPSLIVSCSDDESKSDIEHQENLAKLPNQAQLFINSYMQNEHINRVEESSNNIFTAYYYQDKNTIKIEFDKDGNWMTSRAESSLPKSLLKCLPQEVQSAADSFGVSDTIRQIEVTPYGYMYNVKGKYLYMNMAYDDAGTYLGNDISEGLVSPPTVFSDFINKYWENEKIVACLLDGYISNEDPWILYLSNNIVVKLCYVQNQYKDRWQIIDGRGIPLSDNVLSEVPESVLVQLRKLSDSKIISISVSNDRTIYTFKLQNKETHSVSI